MAPQPPEQGGAVGRSVQAVQHDVNRHRYNRQGGAGNWLGLCYGQFLRNICTATAVIARAARNTWAGRAPPMAPNTPPPIPL
jgi:hypothetical protein